MKNLSKILTVDPGDHTGWSYWKGDVYPLTGAFNLSKAKSLKMLENQLKYQWLLFSRLLNTLPNIDLIVIESVEFWEGSLKSITAAKRQNLSKLAYLVGGYANIASSKEIEFRLVPARKWKGQMSNYVLQRKIFSINGISYSNEHILNAVGIGFSLMGYFQNTKNNKAGITKFKIKETKCLQN